ncbi:SDR family NAD(P)-dependent oxidoreductase [Mycolicibacterium sp. 3033]|nr:SDR family NAD(P)-dependent oxidoreductase [Mycolicibacterium aurantiacum]
MTSTATALEVVDGVDLTGKTCVVTGASSGLGRESTRALAAAGAHVILAARNADDVADTLTWVRTSIPAAELSSVHLDLTVGVGDRGSRGDPGPHPRGARPDEQRRGDVHPVRAHRRRLRNPVRHQPPGSLRADPRAVAGAAGRRRRPSGRAVLGGTPHG